MKRYHQFNLSFFAVTISGLLSIGLFNAAIDPYGVINSPKLAGINQLKPKKFSHVRLFKAIDVTRLEPKTILLGSSRADLGLNPKHPALKTKQPAYNLGLVGPNMYEVRRYFDHALENQPELKTVVIGLDFFMFNGLKKNAADFSENRLEKQRLTPKELLSVTLSVDALDSSIETLRSSRNSNAYYLYHPNGLRYIYGNKPNDSLENKFQGMITEFLRTDGYYKEYQLSQASLEELREMVEICKQRNIELKIFISPSHASQWEAIRVAGLWPVFEQWKRELVKITPLWDFSGYNSITTEAINEDMKNYWDSSHYRKEVGDLVLNRLFNYEVEKVPSDFGVFITPENIEAHLAKIEAERQAWAKQNPDAVKFVADLTSSSQLTTATQLQQTGEF